MIKLRLLKIVILTVLFGVIFYATNFGLQLANSSYLWNLEINYQVKYILSFSAAVLAVLLTNQISRQVYFGLRQLLIKLSLSDFVIGIISIIIGLVLGALASTPLSGLPKPWSWISSMAVVVGVTTLAIWAFNLKKQTIIDWFNSIHLFQRIQSTIDDELISSNTSSVNSASFINPMVLDTSAIIDQRIGEVIKSGFLYGTILLPTFILEELQQVADSSAAEKRLRGRRGLKLLQQIKRSKKVPVVTIDDIYPEIELVDSKLVQLALDNKAKIITCDYNLNAVAKVRGVSILNINELAVNLRAKYMPGEAMQIKVVEAGKEDGQGLGYLTDGTLVVVQKGKPYIGKEITVEIQRVLQNAAGRMIFVKATSSTDKVGVKSK